MANPADVGLMPGAVPLPWRTMSSDALPTEFPTLHIAFTFTRREVDALGGLHLFRVDYVEPPDPPQAKVRDHPHHGAPQITAIVDVVVDATPMPQLLNDLYQCPGQCSCMRAWRL